MRGYAENAQTTADDADSAVVINECEGRCVGCFASDAGGTPATTQLLGRERGDDFFEARLAAQGIPERH